MSNLNLNKVVLSGRLTADVELKQTQNGIAVATFTLAINRRAMQGKPQETDFINCQAWRGTAEFVSKYFNKGSAICVTGSIQTRSWNDNNGNKRYATEVVVDEVMFVDSRSDSQNAPQSTEAYNPYTNPTHPSKIEMNDIRAVDTDEDLPF
jgi:single-strand DNA-binding protein